MLDSQDLSDTMETSKVNNTAGVRRFTRRGYETATEWRNSILETSTYFVSVTTIPVILVVTIRMLLSKTVLWPAYVAIIGALAAAAALSYYKLMATPARVAIFGDAASVDDAWSRERALRPENSRAWFRVLDVRGSSDSFDAIIGLDSYQFNRADWAEFDELRTALTHLTTLQNRGDDE